MPLRTIAVATLFAFRAVAWCQAEGIGDATFPTLGNVGYDAGHYALKLSYDPDKQFLTADVTMTAVANKELPAVKLDFTGFTISAVKLNGQPAAYSRSADKLTLTPVAALPAGKTFTVETAYSGKPETHGSDSLPGGIKIGWIAYRGGSVAACEPDLAHTWFPCNDHPRDKASFEFEIETPPGYTAIANGLRMPNEKSAGNVFHWREDKPSMTCMAFVAIGKYDASRQVGPNDLRIENFFPVGSRETYKGAFENDLKYLKFLSEKLGPYPFDSYGALMLPREVAEASPFLGFAALETTTRPEFGVSLGRDPSTLIHEMCHQWMGDCVSVTNWGDDIWWVEGFATYSEWMRVELEEGKPAYDKIVSSTYASFQNRKWLKPGHLTAETMFSEASYQGGALTFASLRMELGDDKFFATIRKFIADHKYGNATSADLAKSAGEVSGKDMKPFFEAWLYGETIPNWTGKSDG